MQMSMDLYSAMEWSLKTPINQLNLPKRFYHALVRARIATIGDLHRLGRENLRQITYFGSKGLEKLEQILEQVNLPFPQDLPIQSLSNQASQSNGQWSLNTPINQLNLSKRLYNALLRAKISTVGDIYALGLGKLQGIPHVGGSSVEELALILQRIDLSNSLSSGAPRLQAMEQNPATDLDSTLIDENDFVHSNDDDLFASRTVKNPWTHLFDFSFVTLTDHQQHVITRRHGLDGKPSETLAEIGDRLGLSRERVRQLENRVIVHMKAASSHISSCFNEIRALLNQHQGIVPLEIVGNDLFVSIQRPEGWDAWLRFLPMLNSDLGYLPELDALIITYEPYNQWTSIAVQWCTDVKQTLKQQQTPLDFDSLHTMVRTSGVIPQLDAVPIDMLVTWLSYDPEIILRDDRYLLHTWFVRPPKAPRPKSIEPTEPRQRGRPPGSANKIHQHDADAVPQQTHIQNIVSLPDEYDRWNEALIEYVLEGLPRGSIMFINIDETAIDALGQRHFALEHDGFDHFKTAVKQRILDKQRIRLRTIQGRNQRGQPQCVAFLVLTVLAAIEMNPDNQTSGNNYFKRLREMLDLPLEQGRPDGLKNEESLWKHWNTWLEERGFQASAQAGTNARRYIAYPISQTLLRKADQQTLVQIFQEPRWQNLNNEDMLFQFLRDPSIAYRLTKHLREIIQHEPSRHPALVEAIYELYLNQTQTVLHTYSSRLYAKILEAGIIRFERYGDEPIYYLHPKSPRSLHLEGAKVIIENQLHSLIYERDGWYGALTEIADLDTEQHYPLVSAQSFEKLVLPHRHFWILVPEPDNEELGDYATWSRPAIGTQSIVLCHQRVLPLLESLRDQGLIRWYGEPRSVPAYPNWLECVGCQVISQKWDSISYDEFGLAAALQPKTNLAIRVQGGLRTPHESWWLAGYAPTIIIDSFSATVQVEVFHNDEQVILLNDHMPNQPLDVKLHAEGKYLIQARVGKELTERTIHIVAWHTLNIASSLNQSSSQTEDILQFLS